jgi:branched-chain amino acid transport system substrate-binding protein
MQVKKIRVWGCFIIFVLLLQTISACRSQDVIRVGFVSDLTGSNAALGVDGRDGAILAVDMINSEGGVNGRPIELVVRDDLGSSDGAIAADEELINDEKLPMIIGHMTSGTMTAAWPQFKDSGVVFLSPTVSTPQLAGLDDNFFRLIVINSFVAERLALYAANDLHLKQIAVFYDTDNASYTDTYRESFIKYFTASGGEIVLTHAFSSSTLPDFKPILSDLQSAPPDGIFIIASAFDTALIAQQAHLEELDTQLLATNWSLTDDLIQNGGSAVDGMITVVSHDENSRFPEYLDFAKRFQDRFGRAPTFAAGYGYEAVIVLVNALQKTDGRSEGLKQALLETKAFTGVFGDISFDQYGDVTRTLYLIKVQDGKFVTEMHFPAP